MDRHTKIKKAIDDLSSSDAKTALKLIMIQLDSAGNNDDAKAELYNSLKELSDGLLDTEGQRPVWEPDEGASHVHIAFGESVAGSLKLAIKQLGHADSHKIVTFGDFFSIGPLWRLHEEEGRARREEWLKDRINNHFSDAEEAEAETDHRHLLEQLERIPAQAAIVVWVTNSAYEQAGLRYALHLLSFKPNNVFIFNVGAACERRFNQIDRRIDYRHSGEIPTEHLKAVFDEKEAGGSLSNQTRKQLEQEWLELAESKEGLRIWDGENIVSVDENYFDSYLLETVEKLHSYKGNDDFIKAARVIGEALGYCEQHVGDGYFEYRLRHLVYNGDLEIKGVPRAMRYYSVKRKR
ncbi:DUF1835 domain-containing protein [Paenibacillus sp. NPDC058071]|uniref:DUF1835 domain-containing protein n=1 Tax=Paenibacillus sp. NPDC058071 TaxID=3346326 RepID=UPI0036D78C3B